MKGRREEIDGSSFDINLGPLGSITIKKDLDAAEKTLSGDSSSAETADTQAPDDTQQ